jgi:hypothetical protein
LPFSTTPEAEVFEAAALFGADLRAVLAAAFFTGRFGRFTLSSDLRTAVFPRVRLGDAFVLRARFVAPRTCRLVAMVSLPVFVQQ